jgi:hypothetical protein
MTKRPLVVFLISVAVVLIGLLGCGSKGEDAGRSESYADSVSAEGSERVTPAPADSEGITGHWQATTGLEQGMIFGFHDGGLGGMQMGSFHDTFTYQFVPGRPGRLTLANPASGASQSMECYIDGDTLTVIRQGDTSVMVRVEAPPVSDDHRGRLDKLLSGKWVVEIEGTQLEHSFTDDGRFVAVNKTTGQRLPGGWSMEEQGNLVMVIQGRALKGRLSFEGESQMIIDTPERKLVFERVE